MATYYSACRQFGTNLGDCPARQMGDSCRNCNNLVWILRKKPQNQPEQAENEQSSTEENQNDINTTE